MIAKENILDRDGFILVEEGQDIEETLRDLAQDSNRLVEVLENHSMKEILDNQPIIDATIKYLTDKYGDEYDEIDLDYGTVLIPRNEDKFKPGDILKNPEDIKNRPVSIYQEGYYMDENTEGYHSIIPELSGADPTGWEGTDANDEHLRMAVLEDNITAGNWGEYFITKIILPKKGTSYILNGDGSISPVETITVEVTDPYDKIEKMH